MQRPGIELGLVMAGAASARAYSAGVLDFLLEALAAYDTERAKGSLDCPSHEVRLRAAAPSFAASLSGNLDTGLFDAALESARAEDRPFYAAWVERFDPLSIISAKNLGVSTMRDLLLVDESMDALLLIDPALPVARHDMPLHADGLTGLCLQLLSDLIAPPAYRTDALAQACGPTRFILAPARCDEAAPLAGPLHRHFREHDYALGRRNAQRALSRHLALPSHHPAVAGWSEAMDREHGIWPMGVARTYPAPLRPILPLVNAAAILCEAPDWPAVPAKALRPIGRQVLRRLLTVSAEISRIHLGPLASFIFGSRRRSAVRSAVAQLHRVLDERGQIEGRAMRKTRALKPSPAERPRLKRVPLPDKRRKPAAIQTAGWGYSIDGREDGAIRSISTKAEISS
jgi:hypothetical protein